MIAIVLGIALATLLVYAIFKAHQANQYWKQRGLKSMKPFLFFGNILPVALRRKNICDVHTEVCYMYPEEPILGFYDGTTPRIIVQEPEYIEKIFITDFQHFTDHGFHYPDEKTNPIDHFELFALRGAKWRAFRYKLSPIFTTSKLKLFYENLDMCGKKAIKLIESLPRKDVNLREVIYLFVTDFVGMTIFGFDAGTMENPDSEFQKMGRNTLKLSFIKTFLLIVAPKLGQYFGTSLHNQKKMDYFSKLFLETFNYRIQSGMKRNDFIQLMIQLKEHGKIEIRKPDPSDDYLKEVKEDNISSVESWELTDVSLMAQAYNFMTTGLDTIPSVTQYCLFELSKHQDIQKAAREEIFEKVKQHSGLSYEALRDMTYLENIMNETSRLHPIVIALFRECTKDYTFPNGFKIFEGESIHIPIHSIQRNPKNHSDPLEFKPERFNFPMKPGTFFPFGDGPRICIGMRYSMLQIKYALAKILLHYNVKLGSRTKIPYKLTKGSIVIIPEEPMYFDLEPIS